MEVNQEGRRTLDLVESEEQTRVVIAVGAVAVLYYLHQLTQPPSPLTLAQTPAVSFWGYQLQSFTISSDVVMQLFAVYIMGVAVTLVDRWIQVGDRISQVARFVLGYSYRVAKISYTLAVFFLLVAGAIRLSPFILAILITVSIGIMLTAIRRRIEPRIRAWRARRRGP